MSLLPAAAASAVMAGVLLLDIALIPALIAGGIAFLAAWWVVARWADPESIARVRAVIGR